MDEALLVKAMAAGARAFADAVEEILGGGAVPEKESLRRILSEVRRINDDEGRGLTRAEMRVVARAAGRDPRGTASLYSGNISMLEIREDKLRYITKAGRVRLKHLAEAA